MNKQRKYVVTGLVMMFVLSSIAGLAFLPAGQTDGLLAVEPTRTPVAGEPPPKRTPVPDKGGDEGRNDDGDKDDDDGPPPRPVKPNPVSDVTFAYTTSGDQVNIRLENAGPDDAGGVCLKVWGNVSAAWVEWGDATVRPGGADLCWHELYFGHGTNGSFTAQNLSNYAELHYNGQYRVVNLTAGPGNPAGGRFGLAYPLARPSLQFDTQSITTTWAISTNIVSQADGLTGKAYDTMLWFSGSEDVAPAGPVITLPGEPSGALPVSNEAGVLSVFVTTLTPDGYTNLDVYRLDPEATDWGIAYQDVLSGTYQLRQNEVGPVLVGKTVRQAQILADGMVELVNVEGIPWWAHQFGDGSTQPDISTQALGVRYDPQRNNYLVAVADTPLVDEETGQVIATLLTVGTTPAIYLDALLTSELVLPPPGMELTAVTVDGDFYCTTVPKGEALVEVCTQAELTFESDGQTIPLVIEGPGTYDVPGHLDQDVIVSVHLYPIDQVGTSAIRAIGLNYGQIVMPKIEQGIPLEPKSGEGYVQFDAFHPRRLQQGESLYSGVAEMPVEQAKLRSLFLDADIVMPVGVWVLSVDDPPVTLAYKEIREPGWFTLNTGVYEPFRLMVSTVYGETTVRGMAAKWSWQGIY